MGDARLGRHSIEGRHPWGYFERSGPGGGALSTERLVLFPPGVGSSERTAMFIHRALPVGGACAAMFVMLLLGRFLPPPPAFAVAFGLYFASLWWSTRATRGLRADSVHLAAVTMVRGDRVVVVGNVDSLDNAVGLLSDLDARRERGLLSSLEYHRSVQALFWRLAERRTELRDELDAGIRVADGQRAQG